MSDSLPKSPPDLVVVARDTLCASAPLDPLESWITPTKSFFVRHHFSAYRLDISNWGLTVATPLTRFTPCR